MHVSMHVCMYVLVCPVSGLADPRVQSIELEILHAICDRLPVMFIRCGIPPPNQLLVRVDLVAAPPPPPPAARGQTQTQPQPFMMCARERPEDAAEDFARRVIEGSGSADAAGALSVDTYIIIIIVIGATSVS